MVASRLAVVREIELVAEVLEQLAGQHHLAGEHEVVRAEPRELLDRGRRLRGTWSTVCITVRLWMRPRKSSSTWASKVGRSLGHLRSERLEGGDPLFAPRSRLGEHAVRGRSRTPSPCRAGRSTSPSSRLPLMHARAIWMMFSSGPDPGRQILARPLPRVLDEDQQEAEFDDVARLVEPHRHRHAGRGAAHLHGRVGRSVHQQDARPVVVEAVVLRLGGEDALVPVLLELVAAGLGIGVPTCQKRRMKASRWWSRRSRETPRARPR